MLRGVLVSKTEEQTDLLKLEKMILNFFKESSFLKIEVASKTFLDFLFLPFFTIKLFFKSFKSDFIVANENSFLGFWVVLVCFLNSKESMVILKDDALWSSYLNRSTFIIPIRDFYRVLPKLRFKEKILFFINRFICNYSDYLVFYDKELVELWANFYGFNKEKALIIEVPKIAKRKKVGVLAKKTF
jgi:hypothetical protein